MNGLRECGYNGRIVSKTSVPIEQEKKAKLSWKLIFTIVDILLYLFFVSVQEVSGMYCGSAESVGERSVRQSAAQTVRQASRMLRHPQETRPRTHVYSYSS